MAEDNEMLISRCHYGPRFTRKISALFAIISVVVNFNNINGCNNITCFLFTQQLGAFQVVKGTREREAALKEGGKEGVYITSSVITTRR